MVKNELRINNLQEPIAGAFKQILTMLRSNALGARRAPAKLTASAEFASLVKNLDHLSYIRNISVFVRAYELGSMSAAARDQRVSAAVVSSRIIELEKHLGVRLFNRTTRKLTPTEHGEVFYVGAVKILDAVLDAEAAIAEITNNPRGSIYVAAPLGIGKRLIAPLVPQFNQLYPEIDVRLRLSDRRVDITKEGLDIGFVLGKLEDSDYRVRQIAECERVLCASPDYIKRHGAPSNADELVNDGHRCLMLRFPGSTEFTWALHCSEGVRATKVRGPFESDDGDVLTNWALDGHGIINKPRFEVQPHLDSGKLCIVCEKTPPESSQFACLFPHKRLQDPKTRLLTDFMIKECRTALETILKNTEPKPKSTAPRRRKSQSQ